MKQVVFVLIALFSVLICAFGMAPCACAAPAEIPATLALGSPAPDFKLPGVDGRDYALKDFAAAKILVVIFTCNHCPTAQLYEERIKKIVTEYKDKGVAVVAISSNDPKSVRLDELGWTDLGDSFAEMKIRAKECQFNFPYLYDGDAEAAARLYGPVATPHIFIFDSERKLRYVGRIDDSELPQHVKVSNARDAIDALLAGKEPPVAKTKAAGCSIKWAGKADAVKAYLAKLAAEPVSVAPADAEALKDLRKGNPNKVRLVSFWATWCAPCLAEFNELVTINRMYRHRDFELVTVAMNRPEETSSVLKVLQKEQASNRNLIFASPDRDKLIDAFDPEWQGAVPYTVLMAPDGKILFKKTDSIDPLELKRVILKALNEKKPWKQ
ncbi:MAG: redoxin family protein [Candidatus Sumerlaeota bacterium]|nr:redoxin family protein [Candidatus Sumerlaeota bacterium]